MKKCQLEDGVGVKFALQVKRKGYVSYRATIKNRNVQQFYATFKAFNQVLQTQVLSTVRDKNQTDFKRKGGLQAVYKVVNMSKWNLSKYLEFRAKITLIRS